MNQGQAKWLLIGGLLAVALAFVIEMATQATTVGYILLAIGAVATIASVVWYLLHPIKRGA